jgi:transposase
MAIALPDSRGVSDEVTQALRLRALHGIELGFSQIDVAQLLGVACETISRWWTAYTTGGLESLPHDRTGRPVGSGCTLSNEQATHLQQLIDTKSPADLEIAAPLWNRRAVRDLILKEYGIRMPIRTVGEYLRRWGYTAKKPSRHARKQDPEEVQDWLEQMYPAIEKLAEAEHATIFWCDETGVVADEHPGYGYAREGQRATIEVPDPHVKMNMISGISNTGDLRFMTYSGTMTADRFIAFLDQVLTSVPGTIFVIVDNLPAHDKDIVVKWVEAHEARLAVFYLPRYSPELNPDEYLNNDLKGQVHDEGLPDSSKTLRSRIQRFMHKLLMLPKHVMSYFCHPCVHYCASDH